MECDLGPVLHQIAPEPIKKYPPLPKPHFDRFKYVFEATLAVAAAITAICILVVVASVASVYLGL